MSPTASESQPNLLLYYPKGFAPDTWAMAHENGLRPEASHWGMHQACEFGFQTTGSIDKLDQPSTFLGRISLSAIRADWDHARVNNQTISQADAIWAMSERELMAIIADRWSRFKPCPVITSDVCWLLDEWPDMSLWRRSICQKLLSRADALMTVSNDVAINLRRILPDVRVETYRFGTPEQALAQAIPVGKRPKNHNHLDLLMPGNDLRRDWVTACAAMQEIDNAQLTMLSKHAFVADHAKSQANTIHSIGQDYRDLVKHYTSCDAVLIASLPNRHGAGLTMLLEAAALAIPLIIAEDPTLREYLDESHALWVSPQDPRALSNAIKAIQANPQAANERAHAARAHLIAQNLTTHAAAQSRADIVHNILASKAL